MHISPVARAAVQPAINAPSAPPVSAPAHAPISIDAQFVGLKFDAAYQQAKDNGITLRISVKDGQPQMGTMDFRRDRVNVAVDAGTITGILGRG